MIDIYLMFYDRTTFDVLHPVKEKSRVAETRKIVSREPFISTEHQSGCDSYGCHKTEDVD